MIGSALRLFGRVIGWLLLLTLVVLAGLRLAAWWREGPLAPPPGMTMVSTEMGQVAVRLSGPENGRRIALVHGSAAWSGFWRDVAADLAAKGWRVIAIDTPPFGYSARDPQGRYDRVSQARRLGDVLRNSGGPAVVLGHSFGAGAATELALTEPALVERLVLVDAAMGSIDPPAGAGPGTASELLAFAPLGQAVTAAAITNPPMTGPLLRSFITRKEAAAPWIATLAAPMQREGSTTAYAQWLPTLLAADEGARSRRSAELSAIRVPVRLVWGDRDTVTPPDQALRLERLLAAPPTNWVRGAGHIPHIEAPREFLLALDRALAQ